MSSFISSAYATANSTAAPALDESSQMLSPALPPQNQSPSRQRRATVSTRSPEPVVGTQFDDIESGGSPSKRKEKSRSHADLLQRHITPIAMLELELQKCT